MPTRLFSLKTRIGSYIGKLKNKYFFSADQSQAFASPTTTSTLSNTAASSTSMLTLSMTAASSTSTSTLSTMAASSTSTSTLRRWTCENSFLDAVKMQENICCHSAVNRFWLKLFKIAFILIGSTLLECFCF